MKSLKDQLNAILREMLPASADEALNGTELLEKVRGKLSGKYAEASIRQHFSAMSADPTSPIAKVAQGQGYYRRPTAQMAAVTAGSRALADTAGPEKPSGGREQQLEEKFRSFVLRYRELVNIEFPVSIEHARGVRQIAGINKWKFPDIVSVRWEVGEVYDKGYRLAKDLLEVMRGLGDRPFRLTSVELKVELLPATLREAFFQCVSNSKWAHAAQLTVACKITEELVEEELRRLGASYDVSVVSFGLDAAQLDRLPAADVLLKLPAKEFELIIAGITPTTIAAGRDRDNLDWEHLRDLRHQSPDMKDLFVWLGTCLEQRKAFTFTDWRQLDSIQRKNG